MDLFKFDILQSILLIPRNHTGFKEYRDYIMSIADEFNIGTLGKIYLKIRLRLSNKL